MEEWQQVGERHRQQVERSQHRMVLWMLALAALMLATTAYSGLGYRRAMEQQAEINQALSRQIRENARLIGIIEGVQSTQEARDEAQQRRDEVLKATVDVILEKMKRKR